ncbi:MAG: hypothetical protein JEZ11_03905 [Desulfobacterales bacterium]|nr:hypothetical protein [Desulfobacterales bacterium]
MFENEKNHRVKRPKLVKMTRITESGATYLVKMTRLTVQNQKGAPSMNVKQISQVASFLKAGLDKKGWLDVRLRIDHNVHSVVFSYPDMPDSGDNTMQVSYRALVEALELAVELREAQKAREVKNKSVTTRAVWHGKKEALPDGTVSMQEFLEKIGKANRRGHFIVASVPMGAISR